MYKAVVHLLDIFLISAMNTFLLRFPIWISLIASLIIYLGLYSFRVYDKDTMKSYTESLIRTLLGTIIGFVGVLILYFFLDNFFNRHFFSTNLLFTIFLLPILHKVEYNTYEKYLPVRNYIVIGRRDEIGYIMDEISEKSMNKMRFVQYINPNPVTLEKAVSEGKSAKEQAAKIHGIIVADPELEKIVKPQIERYKSEGLEIQYLPNVVDKYLKRIPVEVVEKFADHYKIVFEEPKNSPTVRILDIIFSIVLIVISSPFLIISMLAILIDDLVHKQKVEIFFKQERYGQNGRKFEIYKLKTMRTVIDENGHFEDVPTKIGIILRKFRLNELPQLLNVLKNDISLVGPRPDIGPIKEFSEKNIPFYSYRTKVPQGITGHAQVFFRYPEEVSKEIYSERVSYDLYYVKNYSTSLYMTTLLRTIETVVMGRGK